MDAQESCVKRNGRKNGRRDSSGVDADVNEMLEQWGNVMEEYHRVNN